LSFAPAAERVVCVLYVQNTQADVQHYLRAYVLFLHNQAITKS